MNWNVHTKILAVTTLTCSVIFGAYQYSASTAILCECTEIIVGIQAYLGVFIMIFMPLIGAATYKESDSITPEGEIEFSSPFRKWLNSPKVGKGIYLGCLYALPVLFLFVIGREVLQCI